jgi:membrane protein DedA with SNARE-associated domain
VDKRLLLWVLVVFFGSSIIFRAIRRATEDESAGVSIVLGLAAFGVIVGGLTWFVKWRDRGGS